MARKQSQMGASKYEFNPTQFEIDIANNLIKHQAKRDRIKNAVKEILEEDPALINETYHLFIQILRDFKQEHNV